MRSSAPAIRRRCVGELERLVPKEYRLTEVACDRHHAFGEEAHQSRLPVGMPAMLAAEAAGPRSDLGIGEPAISVDLVPSQVEVVVGKDGGHLPEQFTHYLIRRLLPSRQGPKRPRPDERRSRAVENNKERGPGSRGERQKGTISKKAEAGSVPVVVGMGSIPAGPTGAIGAMVPACCMRV